MSLKNDILAKAESIGSALSGHFCAVDPDIKELHEAMLCHPEVRE